MDKLYDYLGNELDIGADPYGGGGAPVIGSYADATEEETVTLVKIQGDYINSNAEKVHGSNSTFAMSEVIHLYQGDVLSVRMKSSTGMSAIAKETSGGYASLVVGLSISEYNTYTYTAEKNCDVIVSGITSSMTNATIVRLIKGVNHRLSDLEAKLPDEEDSDEIDKYRLPSLPDNPLAKINFVPGFAATIRTWGFVGDSLSSGEIWGPVEDNRYHRDIYDFSWGQYLCRMTGAEGYNYSVGGGSAKSFVQGVSPFSNTRDLAKLLSDPQKQAYTIVMGQNDGGFISSAQEVPEDRYAAMGDENEMVDPSDPTNHGNTFVGYYTEMLVRIANQFPDSLIFMATIVWNNTAPRDQISIVIRQIYEHYKEIYPKTLWLVDLEQYGRELTVPLRLNGLHLSAQGYLYNAYIWATYVDWILRKNIKTLNPIISLCGTGHNEL